MTVKNDSFKRRFLEALNVRNIQCSELSRRTGIRESTLSQYKSGYVEPKSEKLNVIAQALNVDSMWLMGMNVPMEKHDFSSRLREAMSERNVKQIELANSTKIPKSSINQYLSGYAKPSLERMLLLCQALDVNLAWLIGMDVPMEKDDDREGRILECARRIDALDPEKQKEVFDYISFLESRKSNDD